MHLINIVDSVDPILANEDHLIFRERYYLKKYCVKFSTKENNLDQCISFHTNRTCLISLAENHAIIKSKKEIQKIDFVVDGCNRLLNRSSGKTKRGAQKLKPDSILCYIRCTDGTTYPVYSCVKGKLLEINEKLIENPQLLLNNPTDKGYIALILPQLESYEFFKESMISKEDYFSLCQNS